MRLAISSLRSTATRDLKEAKGLLDELAAR